MSKQAILHEVKDVDYERQRNKPSPDLLHGFIQSEISVLLQLEYGWKYDFPSEVTLATEPPSTPDICIYPPQAVFDWLEMPEIETEMPITTIEILSPSQSLDEMVRKIKNRYFPKGVKSAWIVLPGFKAIHLMLPSGNRYFDSGNLTDPATGIEISIEKVFERVV
ncbi:MAG: Uma2 family endonuclease [Bacteroidota bacterium]